MQKTAGNGVISTSCLQWELLRNSRRNPPHRIEQLPSRAMSRISKKRSTINSKPSIAPSDITLPITSSTLAVPSVISHPPIDASYELRGSDGGFSHEGAVLDRFLDDVGLPDAGFPGSGEEMSIDDRNGIQFYADNFPDL
jgi:hypothetical protein